MAYDYRNRMQENPPGYAPAPAAAASTPMYPRIAPSMSAATAAHGPPQARNSYGPPSASSGTGIRVVVKPEYRIMPPPQLAPLVTEVPRSEFHFDFEFERKILAEAEKESSDWSRITAEHQQTKPGSSSSALGPVTDPVVEKYVNLGLAREPVSIAITHYGDNNVKIREFVKGFSVLREMGFSSKSVGEVLASYDCDTDKALAHLLNSSS